MGEVHHAHCLCGAVNIRVEGPLSPGDACHCSQCRRQSGHYWASTDVARDSVTISGDESLTWYQSSEKVRRGFCTTCGSFLLWDVPGRSRLAIALGAFDAPTGTHLEKHIFVGSKDDYYEIADGLPKTPE
ncbi:GFA family protein [Sandarakinorhabdus oryzae]|uniref:GFA family protein n=1 Tax=Sandarakinorhabdus oryzae TaxID=2675220 RepID=UPI0012E0E965|nr:GFA family protein [Sandarakinorhabdus oryzae]